MAWTIFLILWLALCVTGIVASGYGFYELFMTDRPAKPKAKAKEEGKEEEADLPAVEPQTASAVQVLEDDEDLDGESVDSSLEIDLDEGKED